MIYQVYSDGLWKSIRHPMNTDMETEIQSLGFPCEIACPLGREDAYIAARVRTYHGDLTQPFYRYCVVLDIGDFRDYVLCQTVGDFIRLSQMLAPILQTAMGVSEHEDFVLHSEGHSQQTFPFCPHCPRDEGDASEG